MYISDINHFLDEQGNIPRQMLKPAREMAKFLAFIIDFTTQNKPTTLEQHRNRVF